MLVLHCTFRMSLQPVVPSQSGYDLFVDRITHVATPRLQDSKTAERFVEARVV